MHNGCMWVKWSCTISEMGPSLCVPKLRLISSVPVGQCLWQVVAFEFFMDQNKGYVYVVEFVVQTLCYLLCCLNELCKCK